MLEQQHANYVKELIKKSVHLDPIDALKTARHIFQAQQKTLNAKHFEGLIERIDDIIAASANAPKPVVIITLDGGLVDQVYANLPELGKIECRVVDYDVEGADDSELHTVKAPPGDKPGGDVEVYIDSRDIEIDPEYVGRVLAAESLSGPANSIG
jgi:hypothetical protein